MSGKRQERTFGGLGGELVLMSLTIKEKSKNHGHSRKIEFAHFLPTARPRHQT